MSKSIPDEIQTTRIHDGSLRLDRAMEKFPELKEDVRQLIADIIGEDRHHEEQFSSKVTKAQQRQRAKERGVGL